MDGTTRDRTDEAPRDRAAPGDGAPESLPAGDPDAADGHRDEPVGADDGAVEVADVPVAGAVVGNAVAGAPGALVGGAPGTSSIDDPDSTGVDEAAPDSEGG